MSSLTDGHDSPDDSESPLGTCDNDSALHSIEKNMTSADIHRGLERAKLRFEKGQVEPEDRSPLILFLNTEYVFPSGHAFCSVLENDHLPLETIGQDFVSIYNVNRRWDDKPIKSTVSFLIHLLTLEHFFSAYSSIHYHFVLRNFILTEPWRQQLLL